MLGHVSLYVQDLKKAKKFYSKALAPLGYTLTKDFGDAAGFMADGNTDFWIMKADGPVHHQHIAFVGSGEQAVQDFYDASLAAGGKDNGQPGQRPDYGPNYYAAYVYDREGNNIEGVFWG